MSIEAMKQAQEPVECMCGICKLNQRQWQGLTEIEFRMIYVSTPDYKSLWQAIEAKLKEKNNA